MKYARNFWPAALGFSRRGRELPRKKAIYSVVICGAMNLLSRPTARLKGKYWSVAASQWQKDQPESTPYLHIDSQVSGYC